MAEVDPAARTVNARILYWGPAGSGKTMNLRVIHAKLRADNRGELQAIATRLDPTVTYEVMPIQLGDVGGFRTQIQVVAAPGDAEQAPTRKQLLDQVDGIVFVADARRDRIDQNVASFEELRGALAAYGRSLDDVPLVIQYNQCDLSDPYTLEELHRKLETKGAAAFEAVAHQGRAVLPTLTTISKRVIRALRERPVAPPPPPRPAAAAATQILEPPAPQPAPAAPPALEDALLAEVDHPGAAAARDAAQSAEALFEASPSLPAPDLTQPLAVPVAEGSLQIAGVGTPEVVSDTTVRIPLSLRDDQGGTFALTLTLSLDAWDEGGDG